MQRSLAACAIAALLGFGALAHADEHERHRGGDRRDGQVQPQPGWQRHGGPPPGRGWRQQPYVQPQPYPQQDVAPQYPQRGAPPQRFERPGPPVYAAPVPQYAPPQYAPAPQYAPPPQYLPPPAPRWNHARGFRPGDALPPEYRQRQFIVRDWRSHRLYAPPPGYVWVQPEPGSYLLIGNNGVIANMLVGQ